jgi:hypothetical protein
MRGSSSTSGGIDGMGGGPGQVLNKLRFNLLLGSGAVDKGSPLP